MAWKRKSKGPDERDYRSVISKIKSVADFKPEMKVILYGRSSTGKTTLAATFPKPVLVIDVKEKGTDSIRTMKGIKVIRVSSWQEIEDVYWYLKKEPGNFKTVIIDTVSQAQELAIREILEENKQDTENAGDWGTMSRRMWGKVSTKLKVRMLDFLELDMNVVLVAHDRTFNVDEEENSDAVLMPEVGPRLMPSVATVLNGAVAVIGNTFIRERTQTIKLGPKKTRDKRVVEYCMRIGPHAIYTTKLRKPKEIVPPAIVVNPSYEKILALMSGEE